LLIQNNQNVTNVPKEILDLNGLENALKSNAMIKTAEVYLAVDGKVRADVIQRKPIARVSTNASYYIDDEGRYMPLSTSYSAHVPIVTGHVEKNNLKNIYTIASKIFKDEFLKTHIVEIHQSQDQSLSLKTRVFDFEIELGDLNDLDKKINNLKAFYQKAKKDKMLNTYSKVNLQFNNQVVCTKK
jgi:cell division protein FtsQ